jgi:hypothetical protein
MGDIKAGCAIVETSCQIIGKNEMASIFFLNDNSLE